MEPLLTRPQVAKLLGVGITTVYQLQQEGKLPVVKIGSSVRYRPDDVRKLVDTLTK
jgi:excisionase family DNA binding protein